MQIRNFGIFKVVLVVFTTTLLVFCSGSSNTLKGYVNHYLNSKDLGQFHINSFSLCCDFKESDEEKNEYTGYPCILSFSDEEYKVNKIVHWEPGIAYRMKLGGELDKIVRISHITTPYRVQIQIKDRSGVLTIVDLLKDDFESPDWNSYQQILSFLNSKEIYILETKNFYTITPAEFIK